MVDVQTWFKENYETKKNNKAIAVKEGTELKGDLEIKDYPDLETIFLPFTKEITKLTISGCPKIQVIFVPGNKIAKIEGLKDLAQLRELNFSNNQVEEIDISNNNALEELFFHGNPKSFKFTGGFETLKNLLKLVTWNSADTLSIAEILKDLSESELKEVVKWLNLDAESKDIKKLIKDEIDKINSNKQKLNDLNTGLIGLIDKDGKVDDNKLAEIRTGAEKGSKYQALVDESKNDPVKSEDKKDIDQAKLTAVIDGSKTSANAISKLGVKDLDADLDKKLGGAKLTDFPDPQTLKELIEEFNKSKGLLDKAGINSTDPNAEKNAEDLKKAKEAVDKLGLDPAVDIGKQITDLKEKSNRLEIIVKGIYGEKYESERWEMKIEIPTNK